MGHDKKQQREHWRRDKADWRSRRSPYPRELPDDFLTRLLKERNRRMKNTEYAGFLWRPNCFYVERNKYGQAITFIADIWAADIYLRAKWGPKGAMPRRVSEWLDKYGSPHRYSQLSLPKMIRKARKRIELLETPHAWNYSDEPLWQPFDLEH